jgi:hypothetical protein
MESNLYLHLGLCAQSSENCLKGITSRKHIVQGHERSGRARDGNPSDLVSRWKSGDSLLEKSELTTSDTGAVVDWLSIESCGQRDAHFKGSDLQAAVTYFSAGIRTGIPSDWLRTSGGIREQSAAGF